MQAKDFFNSQRICYMKYARWTTNQDLILASKTMVGKIHDSPRYVAELGAGSCTLLNEFDYPMRIGIDISIEMLSLCQNKHISRIGADVHELPLASQTIDLVLCRQVIHYCHLPQLAREIRRILTRSGYLHIVQITDFDSVPQKIYDYWAGLRGISERKHVGRKQVAAGFVENGFVAVSESSFFLRIEHTWESFFEKNRVQGFKQREVKDFFFSLEEDICRVHQMQVGEEGLSYIRRLSLFLFRSQGDN